MLSVGLRSMRQLPDPILQTFNSRPGLVGLGKCRMNQVSLQSARMYKASRCPTPFWHEISMDLIRIVDFTFTVGFINQISGAISDQSHHTIYLGRVFVQHICFYS